MPESTKHSAPPLPFDPPLVVSDAHVVSGVNGPLIDLTGDQNPDSSIQGVSISAVDPVTGIGHILYASENLIDLLGYEPGELLGSSPGVLFAPSTPDAQLDAIADLVEAGKQAVVRLCLACANGDELLVRGSFLRLPSMTSEWPYYLSIFREPTRQATHEQLLADSAEILDALVGGQDVSDLLTRTAAYISQHVTGGHCWIALADQLGGLEPVITGSHGLDLVGRVLHAITDREQFSLDLYLRVADLDDELAADLAEHGIDALWVRPLWGPNGERRGAMVIAHMSRLRPTEDEEVALGHLTRLISLAVERSVAEAHLAHKVLHDRLTMLPNRMLISDRLDQAVARLGRERARLAVLLVDVDRFKLINDAWGPEIGDEVLVEVSKRLRQSVRLGDTVGRISGDQFMVLCVALTSDSDVQAMAERIVDGIGRTFVVGGAELRITASVGVVLVEEPGQSPNVIISCAESALAQAVADGRSRYAVYEKGTTNPVLVRLEVEKALEVAITEDELVVHYQPLVDIHTGRMIGAEALLRWDRPGKGLLPPSEFIEIAEDSGLIVPVGAWVINEVCRQIATWPESPEGAKPVISVNLSARQLSDTHLISVILGALERHRVSAAHLGFEVTESMKVEDVEGASATLNELAVLGCQLSIDDFGIGYATLDYLRRFSMADTIKIDRSFVSGLGISREDSAIVSTSTQLAAQLGLSVVAEGVETYDQFAELAKLGVDVAQGYLLSPPVPLERAIQLWNQADLITPFSEEP